MGHLVPPGQLLPADVVAAIRVAIDEHRFGTGLGVPSVPSRFHVRVHPADRAWLPAGFERDAAAAATAAADAAGLLILDGIQVRFETDEACEMGTVSVRAAYSRRDLIVLRDPDAALSAFTAEH